MLYYQNFRTIMIRHRTIFSQQFLPFFKASRSQTVYGIELRRHALPRNFSNSPLLYKSKKRDIVRQSGSEARSSQANSTPEDPLDLTQLEHGIAAAVSRLKDELSRLRMGGRMSTETIEGLRVQLSKGAKETAKLGELAQVLPKGGRMVTVLVSEENVCLDIDKNPQFHPGLICLYTVCETHIFGDSFLQLILGSATRPS